MPDAEQPKKGFVRENLEWAAWRLLDIGWNDTFLGERFGKFRPRAREEGKPQPYPLHTEFVKYLDKNDKWIGKVKEIESFWAKLETSILFPFTGSDLASIKYSDQPDPHSTHVTEIYRVLGHYRDTETVLEELKIFEGMGTIELEEEQVILTKSDLDRIKQDAEITIAKLEQISQTRPLTENEQKDLSLVREALDSINAGTFHFPTLRTLKIGEVELPYALDGRPEKIVAFGVGNMGNLKGQFAEINHSLNLYAGALGVNVAVRGQIGELLDGVNKTLEKIETIEKNHFENLKFVIKPLLETAATKALDASTTYRPNINEIRFAHTYKIIKKYALVKIREPVYGIVEDDDEVFKIVRTGEVESLKTAYFDPDKNPYENELVEVRKKLNAIKLMEEAAGNSIRVLKQRIEEADTRLKEIDVRINGVPTNAKRLYRSTIVTRIIENLSELIDSSNTPQERKVEVLRQIEDEDFKSDLRELIEQIIDAPQNKVGEKKDAFNEAVQEKIEGVSGFKRISTRISANIDNYIGKFKEFVSSEQQKLQALKVPLYNRIKVLNDGINKIKARIKEKKELEIRQQQLEGYIRHHDLKPDHSHFTKFGDEKGWGLDENNWPLEVYEEPPNSGKWYVLTDKWWKELSQNTWHMKTIGKKPGGGEMIVNKIQRGVNEIIRRVRRGIRHVDPKFVGDLDPLDKISFISNEWDAYRDDFRDGRFHKHSKTSMDYIIAGTKGITPLQPITFDVTLDKDTIINFEPIYDENGNVSSKLPNNIRIPDDERQVTRTYEMEIELGQIRGGVKGKDNILPKNRKPTPFDPAFDRSVLNIGYLHWGRMLYYETIEGINRWSENPFPHITTRGIAKYLIDLAIRRTFSFEEAAQSLEGHEWDYGIRHYGPPFITKPLGVAKRPTGPGVGGEGPLAGAK